MPETDPRNATGPVILCHSHLRWDWVYQRPQHVLSRLARTWPVIVEEEPLFDERPPGLDILSVADGVTVIRPHCPPGSGVDLGRLVEEYAAAVRAGRPMIRWFYSPMFATYGDRLGPDQVVVFDCMDELASFAGAPAGLREAESRLLARADVVFTGGRSIHEAKQGRNPNVQCFPSAVDPDHFARALDPDLAIPGDIAGLPGPVFGYCGVVDERLDYGLIARLADAPGVGSVVLVGPTIKVDPASLPRRPNLHFLGQRPYEALPSYLKGFDACIMPWALNEATRSISPTKTLEYMAAGRPILSTPVRDVVRDHGDLVHVAGDADGFARLAVEVAGRPDPARAEAGRRRAAERGWEATAAAMGRLVADRLAPAAGEGAVSTRPKARTSRGDDARSLIAGRARPA
ncbi:glycosyltransferase [Tundrisphaera sp. TA3]|uniref:glycosyltransferase n=1 Tax=Tundrisphaera sp. TA3 TaxID=3435775 RepID=UPI003EBD2EA0